MKQPELGLKVAELRQGKGFTQEQLAETCEVSTRTIQRIENGEVDPRSFTLTNLGDALDFEFVEGEMENESIWLAALHLSSTICFVLVPLLIWTLKRDQSYKIEQEGKAVLNFQITMTIILFALAGCTMIAPVFLMYNTSAPSIGPGYSLIEVLLVCLTIPLFLGGLFTFYQAIANTVRSLNGQEVNYALSIKFLK